MSHTLSQLIDAASEIGVLPMCNNSYTAVLVQAIEAYGKAVNDLTVAELLQLIETTKQQFNGGT